MVKLKFYTEKKWMPPDVRYVPMLYPFWGNIFEPVGSPNAGRYNALEQTGKSFLDLVENIGDAQVILMPFEYRFNSTFDSIYNEIALCSEKSGLRVLIFFNSDEQRKIKFKNSVVFRTSFNKSDADKDVYSFPGWSVDFNEYFPNGSINFLNKTKLSVGYCGYDDAAFKSFSLTKIKSKFSKESRNYYIGATLRGRALRKIAANGNIKADFLIRNGFWGAGENDKGKIRREYAQNMISNMYNLVTRGAGNFSYRLYEVMSCGRIPLFIDRNTPVPFEEYIDWTNSMVYINYNERTKIDKILLNYHECKTEEELINIQKNNRNIYEEWLSPVGFHKNLFRYLIH